MLNDSLMNDSLIAMVLALPEWGLVQNNFDFSTISFDKQLQFLRDPARFIAACCSRRAGKSYGLAIKLIETASSEVDHHCAYVTESKDTARRILWDVLLDLLDKSGTAYEKNETRLEIILKETGSHISFFGAALEKDQRKIRGPAYKLIIIDEVQNMRESVKKEGLF